MRTTRFFPLLAGALLLASASLVACTPSEPEPEPVVEEVEVIEEVEPEPAEPEEAEPEEEPADADSVDVSALDGPTWHGLMLTDVDNVLAYKAGAPVAARFWIPGMASLGGCSWSQSELSQAGEEISGAFFAGMGKDAEPYLIYTAKIAASGLTADSYETRMSPFVAEDCALAPPVVAQMNDLAAYSLVGVSENAVALVDEHGDKKTVGVDVRSGEIIWEQEGMGQAEFRQPGSVEATMPQDFVKFRRPGSANETVIVDVETGRSVATPGEPLVARFDANAFLAAGTTRTDIVHLDGKTILVGEDDWTNATAHNPGDTVEGHLLSELNEFPVLTADGTRVFTSESAPKARQNRRILYVDAQGQVASVFTDEQSDDLDPEIQGSYGNALQLLVRGDVPVTIDIQGNELPELKPGYIAQSQRTVGGKTWVLWSDTGLRSWEVEELE